MDRLPDWTDLRYFLELARTGTLAVPRASGLTPVSAQIRKIGPTP